MFGSYSVINVVVLLNLLIAMMSNSYNSISERADVEWKFARTTLFMNYFEEGNTVPPPFNIFPTFKNILKLCGKSKSLKDMSIKTQETKIQERDAAYQGVMCNLVWRYVTAQQKELENHPVTEDNINELRQDVYSFRYDLMRVFKNNGMKVNENEKQKVDVTGKRIQIRKRRLIKDFSIGLVEVCTEEPAPEVVSNKSMLARLVGFSGSETKSSQRWRDLIQATKKSKFVANKDVETGRFGSIKRRIENEKIDPNEKVVEYQKNELIDTKHQSSGDDLYPKIQQNVLSAEENIQVITVSSKLANNDCKPKPSPQAHVSEVSPNINNNQGLQNSLPTGVQLSPNALAKNAMKTKYQAPRPEEVTKQSKCSDSKDVAKKAALPLTIISTMSNELHASEKFCSVSTISESMPKTIMYSKEKSKCKDTTITVTSSPEKPLPMNPSTSIEMTEVQTTSSEFIDFESIQKPKCVLDITAVNIDDLSETMNRHPDVAEETIYETTFEKSGHSPHCGRNPQQEEKENEHFSQYKEENEIKNENNVSTSPLLHKKKGWL